MYWFQWVVSGHLTVSIQRMCLLKFLLTGTSVPAPAHYCARHRIGVGNGKENQMKKLFIPLSLVVVFLIACDKNDDNPNDINSTDRSFTTAAAMGNTAEIDAGTAAAAKAESAGIREFGAMMVADHGMAQSELKSIASQLNLRAPDSLDAEHTALKAQLASLSGREFDSVYIHAQVRDHERTIDLFEDLVDDGDNHQLRAFANKTLPHLRHHKHMADSLANTFPR